MVCDWCGRGFKELRARSVHVRSWKGARGRYEVRRVEPVRWVLSIPVESNRYGWGDESDHVSPKDSPTRGS